MSRRRALWFTGATALVLFAVLAAIDTRLTDTGGPGIVPFEFAGSEERAAEIMADWGDEGQDDARLSLWLDFPYLVAYGAFLALAVAATRDAARRIGRDRLARIGGLLVAFPVAGAACDVGENMALLATLGGDGGSTAPAAALAFALAKFALTIAAIVYLLFGLAVRAAARRGGG